jgi:hypothetical protein
MSLRESLALLAYVLHSARLIDISFLSVLHSRSTVLRLSKKRLFLVLFASLSNHVLFWGPKKELSSLLEIFGLLFCNQFKFKNVPLDNCRNTSNYNQIVIIRQHCKW